MPRTKDAILAKMQKVRRWLSLLPEKEREEAAIRKIAGTETLLEIKENETRYLSAENEILRKAAFEDKLTGIPNLHYLDLMAPVLLDAATPEEPSENKKRINSLVAVFIDVNGLGSINKIHGHDYGDALIREAATTLKNHFRRATDIVSHAEQKEIIARKGGDEIILLLPDTSIEFIEQAMEEINHSTFTELNGRRIDVKCSYGYSVYTGQEDIKEMYAEADANMTVFKKTAPKSQVSEIAPPQVA